MATVICVLCGKGGVGRTVLALNLAAALSELPARVLIADCATQQSARLMAARAPEGSPFPATVIGLPTAGSQLAQLLGPQLENYDYVLLDTPRDQPVMVTRAALAYSDIVLIPVPPSMSDMLSALDTANLAKELEAKLGHPLKLFAVINMMDRTTVSSVLAREIRKQMPYPTLQSEVHRRVAFNEAGIMGTSVLSCGDEKAAQEIRNLRDEILRLAAEPRKGKDKE